MSPKTSNLYRRNQLLFKYVFARLLTQNYQKAINHTIQDYTVLDKYKTFVKKSQTCEKEIVLFVLM